jgi:beta-galactosidase
MYRAKSIYNVYSPNTFSLSRRLFGLHSISFVTFDKLSLHGFSCPVTSKARAQLHAADADSITGDKFRKEADGSVMGIGNNVSLVFSSMDFGGTAPGSLTVEGFARSANTIRLVITAADGRQFSQNLEFLPTPRPEGDGSNWEKRTFSLTCLNEKPGMTEVSFIFLPGSDFDFRAFRFA